MIIVCGGFTGNGITNECNGYNISMSRIDNTKIRTEFGVPITNTDKQLRSDVEILLNKFDEEYIFEPMPLGLQYSGAAIYDDYLYIVGGLWRDDNNKGHRSDKVFRLPLRIANTPQDYIYFYNQDIDRNLNSSDPNNNIEKLNYKNITNLIETNQMPRFPYLFNDMWEEMPKILSPRSTINCQTLLNVLYCFGGSNENKTKSKKMDIFRKNDLTQWHEGTEMSIARSSFSSAIYQQKIYATGGINNDGKSIGSIDVYNPYIAKWTLLKIELSYPRYYHTTFMINNFLIVRGGTSENNNFRNNAQRSIEYYDLTSQNKRFEYIIKYDSKILHTSTVISKDLYEKSNKNLPIIMAIVAGSILVCIFLTGCCYIFCKYYCDCVGDDFSEYEEEYGGRPNIPGMGYNNNSMQYGLSHHPSQEYYYD